MVGGLHEGAVASLVLAVTGCLPHTYFSVWFAGGSPGQACSQDVAQNTKLPPGEGSGGTPTEENTWARWIKPFPPSPGHMDAYLHLYITNFK